MSSAASIPSNLPCSLMSIRTRCGRRCLACSTASSPDGVPQLCSDERKATYKAIERICKIFGAENFIAGGNILKALSDELHVADHKKKVFFFDVLYAWDLGYLRDKLFPRQ